LSVIAEASSHFYPSLPPERLSLFSDHFHPAAIDDPRIGISSARPEARRRGSPFLAINVLPHDEQVCHVRISDPPRLNLGTGHTGHRQGHDGQVGFIASSFVDCLS
jgi:hypothetical protein